MRAVCIPGPNRYEVIRLPDPVIGDYECLVRTRACALCNATDGEIVAGTFTLGSPYWYPLLLGHEGAGEIVAVGSRVTGYAVGQHVINPESHIIKGKSEYCPYAGQFAEYTVVTDAAAAERDGVTLPPKNHGAYVISPEIPWPDAAAMVSLREVMSGVRNIGVTPGSSVLIYGDGPNGAGLVDFCRLAGADYIAVAGHHDERLKKLAAVADRVYNSAVTDIPSVVEKESMDFVIDAAGSWDILVQGSKLVKKGGTLALYGVLNNRGRTTDINDLAMHIRFYNNSLPYGTAEATPELERLILEKKVVPSHIYSHAMPVEEFARAFELVRDRKALKAVLLF